MERRDLRHKVSDVSAIDPLDAYQAGPRDSVVSLPSPVEEVDISRVRISGRESPRSSRDFGQTRLPETLRVGTPTTPTAGFNLFHKSSSQSYALVASTDVPSPKPPSKRFSKKSSRLSMSQGSIPEGEEIGMNLLRSAMPMGFAHKTSYSTVEEDDQEDIGFDVSSFSGPTFTGAPRTKEQVKEGNKAEAAGILTGGLGAGWKPDTTIRSTELLATAPTSPTLSRGLSFRNPRVSSFRKQGLARAATVRELGQIEANKRGEIIEVIVEEPTEPTFDISSFSGGGGGSTASSSKDFDQIDPGKQSRKNTMAIPLTETFYPQANWKPFSMRWPYMTFLIIISVVLAAAQEYLCRKKTLYTFEIAQHLSTWSYFTFKYLPTLIAVSFGVLWQVTDFEVKRLEPFYQLSKPGGALAAESINVDYSKFVPEVLCGCLCYCYFST